MPDTYSPRLWYVRADISGFEGVDFLRTDGCIVQQSQTPVRSDWTIASADACSHTRDAAGRKTLTFTAHFERTHPAHLGGQYGAFISLAQGGTALGSVRTSTFTLPATSTAPYSLSQTIPPGGLLPGQDSGLSISRIDLYATTTTSLEFVNAIEDIGVRCVPPAIEPPGTVEVLNTFTAIQLDPDANGGYQILRLNFTAIGFSPIGTDLAEAWLVDRCGTILGRSSAPVTLADGVPTPFSLDFPGAPIGRNGVGGPYEVQKFVFSGPTARIDRTLFGTTEAFAANTFTEFQFYVDQNFNGCPDPSDIETGRSLDENNDGRPDDAPCPSDVDDGTFTGTRDGGVTIDDILYFLARFEVGC